MSTTLEELRTQTTHQRTVHRTGIPVATAEKTLNSHSDESKAVINELKVSDDPERIQERMHELGDSVEKILLADRVRQLKRQSGV